MSDTAHTTRDDDAPALRVALLLLFAIAAGAVTIVVLPVLVELGKKGVALGVLGTGFIVVMYLWRRPREVLLFTFVVALTYNRQFYVFQDFFSPSAAFGTYWMLSDLVLAALVALWAWDRVVLRRVVHGHGAKVWPWFAPFVIVAALSLVDAEEPTWGFSDLLRLLKFGLIFLYFRYQVGQREWWVVVAGLGTGLVIQSMFGMLEIATGRTGIMWLFGGGFDAGEQLGITQIFGGWVRATGTMGHPPYLATFMLLTLPIFLSLSLSDGSGRWRPLFILVTAIGFVGLGCTLSRLPITVAMGQTALLICVVMAFRWIKLTRLLGILAVGTLLVGIMGAAFADRIYARVTGDLKDSVDARAEEYRVSLAMLQDFPLLGVGLNNHAAHMGEYGSQPVRSPQTMGSQRLVSGPQSSAPRVSVGSACRS